ncbi:MAG: hypothetical protein AAF220_08310, partial [Pseudomonadota bacterium]
CPFVRRPLDSRRVRAVILVGPRSMGIPMLRQAQHEGWVNRTLTPLLILSTSKDERHANQSPPPPLMLSLSKHEGARSVFDSLKMRQMVEDKALRTRAVDNTPSPLRFAFQARLPL